MSIRQLAFIACFALAVLGINSVVLGPSQELLRARLGVSVKDLSVLFVALSFGYLVSSPLLSLFAKHLSQRVLLFAPILLIIAMTAIALGNSVAMLTAAAFVLGLGQAITQVTYLAWIGARVRGARGASGLINRVNALYGVGALIGPILVLTGVTLGYPMFVFWLAAALSALLLLIGAVVPVDPDDAHSGSLGDEIGPGLLLRSPALLGTLLTMALYVGCEVAFSAYSTLYVSQAFIAPIQTAAFATSLFFGGFALSRYFAGALLDRMDDARALALLLCVAGAGIAIMLAAPNVYVALSGAMVVGVGFGPIYPTILSIAIRRHPKSPRIVSSMVTSSGSIGSVTLPYIIGQIIDASARGPAVAWTTQLVAVGLAVVAWLAVMLLMRRSSTGQPEQHTDQHSI